MQAVVETPLVILDTIPEAYIRLDSDHRFTFVNQAAERHLAVSRTQLIGKRFLDVYSSKGAEDSLRRALKKPGFATMELYCPTRQKWSTITVMPDSTGGIVMRLA